MSLKRALMIVFTGEEVSNKEKEDAIKMVLAAFKQQDESFLIWQKIIKRLNQEYRQPINDATKGYNIAIGETIKIVNECFNEVINHEN